MHFPPPPPPHSIVFRYIWPNKKEEFEVVFHTNKRYYLRGNLKWALLLFEYKKGRNRACET